MTDPWKDEDIVTRLKVVAALQPGDTLDKIGWPQEDWALPMHSLIVDAIDEIERLRVQRDNAMILAKAAVAATIGAVS